MQILISYTHWIPVLTRRGEFEVVNTWKTEKNFPLPKPKGPLVFLTGPLDSSLPPLSIVIVYALNINSLLPHSLKSTEALAIHPYRTIHSSCQELFPILPIASSTTRLDSVAGDGGGWGMALCSCSYKGASASKGFPINCPYAHLPQRRQKFLMEVCGPW